MPLRTIGVLLLPGTRVFDFAVVTEVFALDRSVHGLPAFDVRFCSPGRRRVALHAAGEATATHGAGGLAGCDLVLALGRSDPLADVPDGALAALRRAHATGATVASLCSGAFTLAAAGLLAGRPATTHWVLLDDLERLAAAAELRRDVLFVDDGDVLTSAGVVGGLDLCLHLIRREYGADVAARLARRLVMPPIREGGQRQFVEPPLPPRAGQGGIASTMDWAMSRLGEPIGVDDLVSHAAMSERTFQRDFTAAAGLTPGRWLRAQRIRHARRLLETTDLTVDGVAQRSGLGTAANLRRRLRDDIGVSPDAYRRTFRVRGHEPS